MNILKISFGGRKKKVFPSNIFYAIPPNLI